MTKGHSVVIVLIITYMSDLQFPARRGPGGIMSRTSTAVLPRAVPHLCGQQRRLSNIYKKNAGKMFFSVFSNAHLDWLIRFHLGERDFLKKRAVLIATYTSSQFFTPHLIIL